MPSSALTTSVAVYRALLVLYPAEHRREYGPHMLQVFGDCCRDASERGPLGFADLWATTLIDLVKSAFEEHARKGVRMSREGLVRWSRFAAILGGLGWTAGVVLLASRPHGIPHLGLHRYTDDLTPLAFASLCLFMLASVGHALSRDPVKTRGVALTSAVVSVVAIVLLLLLGLLWSLGVNLGDSSGEVGWRIFLVSLFLLLLSHAAVGVSNLEHASTRLVGAALIGAVVLSNFGSTENDSAWLWLSLGLAWIAFGLTHLVRSSRPRTPQAS